MYVCIYMYVCGDTSSTCSSHTCILRLRANWYDEDRHHWPCANSKCSSPNNWGKVLGGSSRSRLEETRREEVGDPFVATRLHLWSISVMFCRVSGTDSKHACQPYYCQGSWQCTALAAKKYFFMVGGAESAYHSGDICLHMQPFTVIYVNSIEPRLSPRKRALVRSC